MPHFVASDLALCCLPMSYKMDARLIWVKPVFLQFLCKCFSVVKR